ncbi:MAG: hypothetical protein RL367_1632, partial [Pseudomonadota bacterium]
GPIFNTPSFGNQGASVSGLTLVYDAHTKSYSLEFPQNSWQSGTWDGPGFNYDPATGLATPSGTTCSADHSFGGCEGGFRIGGSGANIADTVNIAGTPTGGLLGAQIFGPDASDPAPGVFRRIWGFFTGPTLSGSWNLPIYGSSGSTDVPEPGMTLLFAGGVAALIRRRRKARAA